MEFNKNRLRFVHCEHTFQNLKEIKDYVTSIQNTHSSLYGEPMVFKYGNSEEPNIVLAIGSVGDGTTAYHPTKGLLNKTFYIDFSQVEKDIQNIKDIIGNDENTLIKVQEIIKNINASSGFNEDGIYTPEAEDLIIKNATSLKVADELLSKYIIALEKKQELYTKETDTIVSTLEKAESGTTITSNVKLPNNKIINGIETKNIIIKDKNGIFTNVDLDYKQDGNILTFKYSTIDENGKVILDKKNIQLNTFSIIEKVEYDEVTEEIIIKYVDAASKSHELRIPMKVVIEEFEADNTHTNITVAIDRNKAHEKTLISANAKISKISDNILVEPEGTHELYVKGTADNIKMNSTTSGETVEDNIQNLKTQLNDEIERAENIDNQLRADLDNEIHRSTEIDDTLSSKVDEEINRAKNSENTLTTNLIAESNRAVAAETSLSERINTEKTRAEGIETQLRFDLDNEKSRSETIDNELINSLNSEINRAKENENNLTNAITNETNRAIAAEVDLSERLSDETVNRVNEIEKINIKLDNEIDRAKSEDNKLYNSILAETNDRIAEGIRLDDAIISEADRATEAEKLNAKAISDEVIRATQSEIELNTAISAESTRANTEEKKLLEGISNEIIDRANEIQRVEGLINTKTEDIERKYAMSVIDTPTIDLVKEPIENGGFNLSANAKISNTKGNIIISDVDGLFSNIDLTYNKVNNTLQFKKNNETIDIALNSVSTIESITYDADTDEIVIKYMSESGLSEIRFPAKSLFKPIQTDNTSKNVTLEINQVDGVDKISGNLEFKNSIDNQGNSIQLTATQDNKLSANAIISSLPNNALITDVNGALFISNQAGDIKMCAPEKYGNNVCEAITKVDDRVSDLSKKIDGYFDEGLLNTMRQDVNNLKSKTNIVTIDSPSVDLTYASTDSSSSMKADVKMSIDPHNLVNIHDDKGLYPIEESYNGIKFDGNIDYQLFTNKDGSLKKDVKRVGSDIWTSWTRHLQEKRNDGLFVTYDEAIKFMTSGEFLADKRDGEPLLGRYKLNEKETSFILGFVRETEDGNKRLQVLNNIGTIINNVKYDNTDESLKIEFTDGSGMKHTISGSLIELLEEYENNNEDYNVNFDVERKNNAKTIIKADIDVYDCGEYRLGEDNNPDAYFLPLNK